MTHICHYIMLALLLGGLVACSSDDSDDRTRPVYKDIIREYKELADAQKETRVQSNFLWTDKSLGMGWSISERTHRWATGVESTLTFSAETDNNYTLHVQCWPPSYTKTPQELSLFLNDGFVKKVHISPKEKNYSIELPGALLVNGDNQLSFKYAHTQKPCDFSESDDCRELALAFEKIEFESSPKKPAAKVAIKNGVIIQKADASFSYYAKLTEQTRLKVFLKHKPTERDALVTIRTDEPVEKEFRLERKGEQTLDLADFAGEIVEIHFQAAETDSGSNADNSRLEWESIQLESPPQDATEPQNSQSNGAAVRKALNSYNVIYLVLDAFHARHASLYGYERQTTPFLDELAKESIVFDKMFANEPYTLASTATLFTSRYSHEHGLVEEINRIHPIIPTLSELLSGEAIESGLISDSGWLKESAWGLLRGFSQLYNRQPYSQNSQEVIRALEDFYRSQTEEQRTFAYIHLIPPHGPYTPPKQFRIFLEPGPDAIVPTSANLASIDTGKLAVTQQQLDGIIALYDANILFADHLMQQIFHFLEERRILEKSILIVSSDHGEAFRQHGRMLHNTTVFDEMLHVPFLIRFPKELKLPARRISETVSLVDVAPTLAEIFGISELPEIAGTSLLPLVLGEASTQDFVYAESLYTGVRSLRDAQYTYISSPADGDMVFDIVADPDEHTNLIETLPVTAGYYRQMLRPYLRENTGTQQVEMNTLNEDTLKNLEDLGYIK